MERMSRLDENFSHETVYREERMKFTMGDDDGFLNSLARSCEYWKIRIHIFPIETTSNDSKFITIEIIQNRDEKKITSQQSTKRIQP